jgi:ABC-type uncharacterized transport system ATPase subunit
MTRMSDRGRTVAAEDPMPKPDAVSEQRTQPLLEAVDIAAGYGSIPVLKGLSLAVHPGEVVALLGANGARNDQSL